jgi:hypothetical protein
MHMLLWACFALRCELRERHTLLASYCHGSWDAPATPQSCLESCRPGRLQSPCHPLPRHCCFEPGCLALSCFLPRLPSLPCSDAAANQYHPELHAGIYGTYEVPKARVSIVPLLQLIKSLVRSEELTIRTLPITVRGVDKELNAIQKRDVAKFEQR